MQGRYITIAIAVFVVLAAGFFAWYKIAPGEYNSDALQLAFSYPNNYILTEHHEGGAERRWDIIVLADESTLPPPQNSEASPTITIIVLDNLEGQTLEQWVHGSAFSNFKLGGDALASTTVDGEPAIAYRSSGLYENDAVAVAHGAKIYFFSTGWLGESDVIRQDFQDILGSIRFVQ